MKDDRCESSEEGTDGLLSGMFLLGEIDAESTGVRLSS